jgi:hypothetical protein
VLTSRAFLVRAAESSHQFRDETDDDVEPSFDSAVVTQWLTETAKEPDVPARPDTYDAIRARLTSGI